MQRKKIKNYFIKVKIFKRKVEKYLVQFRLKVLKKKKCNLNEKKISMITQIT